LGDVLVGSRDISYVIYGKEGGYNSTIQLATEFNSSIGFRVNKYMYTQDCCKPGSSISSAGDFNGDGIEDFVIGMGTGYMGDSGMVYVIYGKEG
jgi:hypothetical protein